VIEVDAPRIRVLLVDDDDTFLLILKELLPPGRYALDRVATYNRGLEAMAAGTHDVYLVDYRLPGRSGLDLVREATARGCAAPMLVLTGVGDHEVDLLAMKAGAADYLDKGRLDEVMLDRAIRHAIERKRVADDLRQLKKAVDTLQIGLSITDVTGRIVYTNPAEAEMHGFTVEEMLRSEGRALSPREDWQPASLDRLREFRRWRRERVRQRKDGTIFPVQLLSDVVVDEAGRPRGIVTLCEDITERKLAEEALRQSEERYALAVRGTNDGIWDWDLITDRVHYSARWKAILGFEDAEVGDSPEEWLRRVHPDDVGRVRAKLADHREGRAPLFEDEHRIRHKTGVYRWVLSRGFAVRDASGRPHRMAGAETDVTDRRAYDPLTGLPNRALFVERVGYASGRARRRSEHRFALLFIDLDGFKAVNDTLGHPAGDQVLNAVARRFEACVRPGDVVARLGGDEYAVLLERIDEPGGATDVAARILEELRAPFPVSGREVTIAASIGIAVSVTGREAVEDLLRDADSAMYRAKAAGKGRYEVFDEDLRLQLQARSDLEAALRAAVDRGEFQVLFQPIVRLATGRLAGFEALLRWQRPDGVWAPEEFLPAVEETGLILPIGSVVLREACRQARRWQQLSAARRVLPVSVNLSDKQFRDPALATRIEAILHEAGLPPSGLRLEVSEAAIIESAGAGTSSLARLRAKGLKVFVDDFGSGYSSLRYLHAFPVDGLKIDRAVMARLDTGSEPLVRAILEAARGIGIPVVAEGVETDAQWSRMRGLQCELAQGFRFSPPVDAETAASLLAEGAWQRVGRPSGTGGQ
jgi:diguanylate cyclase (GGDEF)-like protein/PAS domain S-box-containing protein